MSAGEPRRRTGANHEAPRTAAVPDGGPSAVAPLLHLVRGDPTDSELAALLAVVAAYAAPAAQGQAGAAGSAWSDPAAGLRRPLAVGPGAWPTSGWQPGIRSRAAW